MMKAKALVAATIVGLALGSAGVAFAKPLTESQWKKQGNAICKQINKELNSIGNEAFGDLGPNEQPTDEQLRGFVDQVLPVVEDGIVSINKLQEPKSLKKAIKKFTSEVRKVIVKLDADPTVLLTNEDPFKTANKAARAVGLTACASNQG
jgi:hypothetical protein